MSEQKPITGTEIMARWRAYSAELQAEADLRRQRNRLEFENLARDLEDPANWQQIDAPP